MSISQEKRRICIFYFLFMFCYILLSLLMFHIYGGFHYKDGVPSSRPYEAKLGMFSVSDELLNEDGKLYIRKEITGFIMEIRIKSCFINIANGTCAVSYKNYPAAMSFVYVALFWHLLLTLFIYTPMTILPLFSTKRLCNIRERTLDSIAVVAFIFKCMVHVLGYVIYLLLIGQDVGFSWDNLTYVVKIGFANASISPFIFALAIVMYYKKHYHSKVDGLVYMKYTKMRLKTSHFSQYQDSILHRTYSPRVLNSKSSETIYHQLDAHPVADEIKEIIEKLWKPAKVGIGRDAKGLYHSSIKIVDIKLIGNKDVFYSYSQRKRMIQYFASTIGGKLIPPQKYSAGTNPIQTAELLKTGSSLVKNLNSDINEHYLFHGTPVTNIESIKKYGFFMEKYKHSMLGKGIYFTEDPVKADQYTGKGGDISDDETTPLCCMLLCRVLLGDSVIQKRHVKNPTITATATSPPCKTCLKPNPHCKCRRSIKFDSVIFDGLLFREFVVYETCLCFPEFAILYKRVKSMNTLCI